jgi:EAL and modified HD-GYP domain-containing signal transduction protein
VLAGGRAFVNVGPRSLADAGALVLLNPRRTVLELSRSIEPTAETLERVGGLRDLGFGVAVSAEPPLERLAPWLPLASHLKVDLQRVPDGALDVFVATLRYRDAMLIAEKVETAEQARRASELGFHAMQGWYVGRPEVMGSVKLGLSHAVLRRALDALAAGGGLAGAEAAIRLDVALCWRLLRYTATSNFGLLIPVESLAHALSLVGERRLARWLQLLLNTVEEPSPAAAPLMRAAVFRGRVLEAVGAEWFDGAERANLFLVGALSLLPAMLMQPMAEAVDALALPEPVADALVARRGPYGPLLELVEAMDQDGAERIHALCERLALPSHALARASQGARAAARELELA